MDNEADKDVEVYLVDLKERYEDNFRSSTYLKDRYKHYFSHDKNNLNMMRNNDSKEVYTGDYKNNKLVIHFSIMISCIINISDLDGYHHLYDKIYN